MGHEADYGRGLFSRADFGRLAEMLHGIRGRFLLSINDRPEIRTLFRWAEIEEVETLYTSNGHARRQVQELLVSGGV